MYRQALDFSLGEGQNKLKTSVNIAHYIWIQKKWIANIDLYLKKSGVKI
tara:strand:- start:5317 stop:5463 length:147 start_codon:yes stop_codon:yes gene_type:complete